MTLRIDPLETHFRRQRLETAGRVRARKFRLKRDREIAMIGRMISWLKPFRTSPSAGSLHFAEFELRLEPLALFRGGRKVKLQRQPLRLLALLASHRGALVSHEDIRELLWNGQTVDFAGGTHVCIRQIRNALGDVGTRPGVIENLPREGYRFLPGVRESSSGGSHRGRWLTLIALAAALLAIAAMLFWPVAPPRSPGFDAYARGEFLLERGDDESARRSLAFFRESTLADPAYAPAYVGEAKARLQLGEYEEARRLAQTGLTHRSSDADALVVLGRVALEHDWRWDEARRRFAAALAAEPDLAAAHHGNAFVHLLTGRADLALQHMARAQELDPGSTLARADYGWVQLVAGNDIMAATLCAEALELEPASFDARICLIRALSAGRRQSEAIPHIVAAMTQASASAEEIAAVVATPDSADVAFERWRLARYERARDSASISDALLANLHAYIGDGDAALDLLERAVAARNPSAPLTAIDPAFRSLAREPRYRLLVNRLGIVPPG